jgi:hypothetical protein
MRIASIAAARMSSVLTENWTRSVGIILVTKIDVSACYAVFHEPADEAGSFLGDKGKTNFLCAASAYFERNFMAGMFYCAHEKRNCMRAGFGEEARPKFGRIIGVWHSFYYIVFAGLFLLPFCRGSD